MSEVYDQLRYSNCWEDADLLLKGLDIREGNRILSVGSGGDNSFSLLTKDPAIVHIIDVNPHQIELIKLKAAAIKTLDHTSFLEFLGFTSFQSRQVLYKKVAVQLDESSRQYWDDHLDIINNGVIYSGKFDRYLLMFAQKIVPLIHSRKKREELFDSKTKTNQERFYESKWNTILWRSFFKLFFSKRFMALAGRHPSFFEHVKEPVSKSILDRTSRHFKNTDSQNNYFLFYMLFGYFGNGLPHYARKENFEKIKINIDQIRISLSSIENMDEVNYKYDCFNLSNIFEYQDEFTFHETATKLKSLGKNGSRYAYWNLLVHRTLHQTDSSIFTRIYDAYAQKVTDYGFFYDNFYVSEQK